MASTWIYLVSLPTEKSVIFCTFSAVYELLFQIGPVNHSLKIRLKCHFCFISLIQPDMFMIDSYESLKKSEMWAAIQMSGSRIS